MGNNIPKEVQNIVKQLNSADFEAYIVGGCVRDLLLGIKPKDWDITTGATPEEIQKVFPDSFYENKFGTVGVKTESEDTTLKVVEVTTFRTEAKYTDKRHPDRVRFTKNIKEDLARRDFTINAMAMDIEIGEELIDYFDGREDLKAKSIRAVGEPARRFNEDALRMMRAVRLAAELGFALEEGTAKAIKKNVSSINLIAKERVKDELLKLFMTSAAHEGIELMRETGLLQEVLPEMAKGIGVTQNKHHIYTVYEHNLFSLQWAAEHDYSLVVRLAAFLHDIAKPQVKQGEGPDSTFYSHEVLGARMAAQVLDHLHFPRELIDKVALLVRHHMFYYNVDEVTERSVRRLLAKVGPENMDDLIKLRICDRMGSGVPKAQPYRLRHFQFMVDKVQKDPISVGMLKVRGDDVMKALNIKASPKVGQILDILLDEVLDEPAKNVKEYQLKRVEALGKLSENSLETLRQKAIETQEEVNRGEEEEIKKRYHV
ncbi:MAG: hypothetical protein A2932_01655 [Candidatus Spechtbacteria bacterium RIFCSPLOWO2_01_FULL_46_10]|uniref:HD domain-containing protein n=1 Tax=Candidatus Spechtbacteria bacterium RIFCSPLOWO2_01_FULL_46_10 TaxID=1802163 RepID=A0A1G2HG41_9BACT|nr:MAG: hypothetical protein A2932_01655 [Candidatus Spechtbacteria bacterium RIFCSPLOWO2_01_FULL_46_10]